MIAPSDVCYSYEAEEKLMFTAYAKLKDSDNKNLSNQNKRNRNWQSGDYRKPNVQGGHHVTRTIVNTCI